MSPQRAALPLSILAAFVLVAGARAHEDDPKAAYRGSPVFAPGYRSNPSHPSLAGQLTAGGGAGAFSAQGVRLMAWLPLNEFGAAQSGNDCWGYTAPSGREYALFGHSHGVAFVEITDPGDPVIVADLAGPPSFYRDVKTYGDHAYVVSEGGDGIAVYDLAQIDSGVVALQRLVTTGGLSSTHNVAVNEASGFLYRCGGSDTTGLRIYDLADPANPAFVSAWSDRYVHDCQVVTVPLGPWAGREIAYCTTGFDGGWVQPGVDILDVTDKQSIVQLARIEYGSAAYAHQCWLSSNGRFLYVDDEYDEFQQGIPTRTRIINVTDPTAPYEDTPFSNGLPSSDHNLYVRGNLIFQANFHSGLRVFDATDPAHPFEIGWFDTWPDDDDAGFNGLWSNYPYFPSGLVIGSDIDRGLFVWWIGDPLLDYAYPSGAAPLLLDPDGHRLSVQVVENAPGELEAGTLEVHWDPGTGWQSAPLTDLGGNAFEALLPAFACGTEVRWYLSARSTSGITWNDPPEGVAQPYAAVAADVETVVASHDFEVAAGWTSGAPDDDATTGHWVRGDPIGSAAQSEHDHTPDGTMCWFTGQAPAGSFVGTNDVDDGKVTLLSPLFDLADDPEAVISYWRWFSNTNTAGPEPGVDVFVVEITNDDATWVPVETVGPLGPEADGGWFQHRFRVADVVAPSATVRLRFVASDYGKGSIIEAAVDDVEVTSLHCACNFEPYCAALPNSTGLPATIGWQGTSSVSAGDLVLRAESVPPSHNGVVIYSPDEAAIPLGDGLLCLGNQTLGFVLRMAFVASTPEGTMSYLVDYESPPHPQGKILPGSTWRFQFWYRDVPAGMSGFNFSEALRVVFCP